MDGTENMCYTARNRQTSDKISALYSNINILLHNSYNSGVSIVLSWLRKLLFKLGKFFSVLEDAVCFL